MHVIFHIFFSHIRWCFAARDRNPVPLVRALLSDHVLWNKARSCCDEVTGMVEARMMCVGRHLLVFFSCFSPDLLLLCLSIYRLFPLPFLPSFPLSLPFLLIHVFSVFQKSFPPPREVEYSIFPIKEVILFLIVS